MSSPVYCPACGTPLDAGRTSCAACGATLAGGAPVPRTMRAAHEDRDRVIEVLRANMVDGRLTSIELEERIETALAARTLQELDALVADLPARPAGRGARSLEYAEYGQRVGAAAVDIAIVIAVVAFLSALRIPLLAIPVALLYGPVLMARSGQTFGKKATKIRVVRSDGSRVTFGQALLRETIGKWLSQAILYLGFLFPLWDPRRQALHDKIADTIVVKE